MTYNIFFDLSIKDWKRISKELTKKQLQKEEKTKIQNNIRKMEYFLWITSPHLKNKPLLQKEIYYDCLRDFKRFQDRSKIIR